MIFSEADVAETFNQFSITIAESLNRSETTEKAASSEGLFDSVFIVIKMLSSHPSIKKIKDVFQCFGFFSFTTFTRKDIEIEVSNLNPKKAAIYKDVPSKSHRSICTIFTNQLLKVLNYCIENFIFPNELKCFNGHAAH